MALVEIANQLKESKEKIILVYAFNATGKTRLSVAYKDATKTKDLQHTGVYYNAFSEDLFVWDNDTANGEENISLGVNSCSLNRFHPLLTEDSIRESLKPYVPKFDFKFNLYTDPEKGIESISFFLKDATEEQKDIPIKISRGEERIFVWCFFLALFQVEGWADQQDSHFFIDDPVSSLDDHNIFVTASTLFDLIEEHHKNRKIIITTHHFGLFSILAEWLKKGEQKDKFAKLTKSYLLSSKSRGNLGGSSANMSDVQEPVNTTLIGDCAIYHTVLEGFPNTGVYAYPWLYRNSTTGPYGPCGRHNRKINSGWIDGHVKSMPLTDRDIECYSTSVAVGITKTIVKSNNIGFLCPPGLIPTSGTWTSLIGGPTIIDDPRWQNYFSLVKVP